MANRIVVVDSGLLVGLIRRDDQYHTWAVARSRQLPGPWLTCGNRVRNAIE